MNIEFSFAIVDK